MCETANEQNFQVLIAREHFLFVLIQAVSAAADAAAAAVAAVGIDAIAFVGV